MSKLTQLFKSPDGGFPKIVYALPVLLIVIGGIVYLSLNIKKGTVKNKIQAASMAVGLQLNKDKTSDILLSIFELGQSAH